MIILDTTHISLSAGMDEHGLDLPATFQAYQTQLELCVRKLWQNQETSKAWGRWLGLGDNMELVQKINAYAQKIHGQFEHLVIIGIGGSSLGAMAMFEALLPSYWNEHNPQQRQGHPKYYFVDNVDPDKLHGLLSILDLQRTLVNVITKSGTTAETMAGYLWLKAELEKSRGS